ncbi:phage major capsid protein [Luteimonas aquatica]|uniref:phage major capsid protein n=1 Tax=Luteimonas aquatica TaxID=450364 RepID=UPI001F5936AC|nr:phage major capsid protein [Luteimonas aquatica]
MPSLQTIREQRTTKVLEARQLLSSAESAKRELTAEEQTKFNEIRSEITKLEESEARQQFLDDAERRQTGTVVDAGCDHGLDELEKRVSLQRVLQAGLEGKVLSGAEAEYNAEMERRNGRKAQGAFIPMRAIEKRVNTAASGANLIGTDHRGDQYIEPLRAALLARRLGVRVLSGLRGNVSIPKAGNSVTTGWVADNGSLTAADMTFGNASLAPKHVGALSEMSRTLIQQSDPSIETLLQEDMSFNLAKAIDRALIVGGGTNEPDGVTATLATANATLATPTWAQVLEIIKDVETANALGAHSWLLSPAAKAKLAGTLKVTGDAGAGFLYENGQVGGFAANVTTQVPAGGTPASETSAIFGDWSQVLLGLWSELDILVNPYDSTAYARGGVMVRAMATCDIAIRHAEAFQWADDVPA